MTIHELDHSVIPMVSRMQQVGFTIDTGAAAALHQRLTLLMEAALSRVHGRVGQWINPDSPQQVGALLFDRLGLRATDPATGRPRDPRKTRTGQWRADKKALVPLKRLHPVVGHILEYVELSTIRGIVRQVIDCTGADGRIHPNLRITRVPTGRLACNGVTDQPGSRLNLLAIPTRSEIGREVRRLFVAPPGQELFTIDLDQIEMRVTADQAGDEGLIEAFCTGKDVHRLSAASCFRIAVDQVTKQQRQIGKTVGFGVLNDMAEMGLLDQFSLDWHTARPQVAAWKEGFRAHAKRYGWVEDMWERRRLLPHAQSPIERVREEGVRAGVNHPIQAGAQGVIKRGMALYWEQRKSLPPAEPLLQVHDELIFQIPAGLGAELGPQLQAVLAEAGAEKMARVPVESKYAIGPTWGDLEK